MSRSIKKGPFVDSKLLKKVLRAKMKLNLTKLLTLGQGLQQSLKKC